MFDLIWRLALTSATVLVAAGLVYATSWPVVWLLIYLLAAGTILRIYVGIFVRRRR